MTVLLILVILLIVGGMGYGYGGPARGYIAGGLPAILVILLVLYALHVI